MKQKYDLILDAIGTFFIVLGILAIGAAISDGTLGVTFWLCYSSLLLIGIGVLKRDSPLITSQLNILTIPLTLWIIDFVTFIIFGHSAFGVVDYFFGEASLFARFISFQHVFTLPLAFYALSKIKIKNKYNHIWIASFSQLVALFIITRLFTDASENINCVYKSCLNIDLGNYYLLAWFLASFIMIIVTNWAINKIKLLQQNNK